MIRLLEDLTWYVIVSSLQIFLVPLALVVLAMVLVPILWVCDWFGKKKRLSC